MDMPETPVDVLGVVHSFRIYLSYLISPSVSLCLENSPGNYRLLENALLSDIFTFYTSRFTLYRESNPRSRM